MTTLFAALWPYALTIGLAGVVLIAAWFVAYDRAPLYGPDEQPLSPVDQAYEDARRLTARPARQRPEDNDPDTAYDIDVDVTHPDYQAGGTPWTR